METYTVMNKAEKLKTQRLPHEAYPKHFISDLQEDIPLWAYVDLFTISDISILYSISEPDIQISVARTFGLNMSKATDILKNICIA